MNSTQTTRDLLAGIRANLEIVRSDLRDLRTDLAYDWRYLRADLRYDWLSVADQRADLADNLRASLVTWCQRLTGRQLPATLPKPEQVRIPLDVVATPCNQASDGHGGA